MIEHIGSHLCLHADTDQMSPILHKITQIHTDDIQKQKSRAADDEHADVLVRYKVLQHQIRQDRIQHTDHRNEQGCNHVQNEQFLVRLVICNKPFQHKNILSFYIYLCYFTKKTQESQDIFKPARTIWHYSKKSRGIGEKQRQNPIAVSYLNLLPTQFFLT